MHKGKCRAEHEQGMPGPARCLEPRQRGFSIQCPSVIVSGLSYEGQPITLELAPNRFEHVHQRGVRRLCGGRGEDCQSQMANGQSTSQLGLRFARLAISHWPLEMRLEPLQQGGLIHRQGRRTVEMSARLLPCRAAGVEYGSPLLRRQARKVELLESRGWRGGNVCPLGYSARSRPPRIAKSAIRCVVLELQREQLQGERLKVCRNPGARGARPLWTSELNRKMRLVKRRGGRAGSRRAGHARRSLRSPFRRED